MKSLLIEEKDKTIEELAYKLMVKIWPMVYGIINGFVNTIYTTVRRNLEIILEQAGLKKRRFKL